MKQGGKKSTDTAAALAAFFTTLKKAGLDGAVLDNRNDQFYLTGFTGSDSLVLLEAKKRRGWLITDSRYTEEAAQTVAGLEVVQWKQSMSLFTGDMIKKLRLARLGYTPVSLTVLLFQIMKARTGAAVIWSDVGPYLAAQRAVKTGAEVRAIKKALAVAEQAFSTAKNRWKIGMTEVEVKNDLEWEMRRLGAEDAAFETIVASGANASLPHAHAGKRKLAGGKMLLIDFGARVGRYNSDLTRTVWLGSIPAAWLKRYQAVLAAQQAGIAAIQAGIPGSEPDRRAREIFRSFELERFFTHSLGHGVGLAVHEEPRLGGRAVEPLVEGNVVTVEPGVYFPDSGGIRVEDMVLVKNNGATVLSSLPKDEASLIIG
ncbi:MAG: aminopeptidase P family protein [Planctomycetes bacterium]|nr:aminopeptidase P family protein [Planctomycetota bacterium]